MKEHLRSLSEEFTEQMKISYRTAEPADIPAITALMRYAFSDALFELMHLRETGLTFEEILTTMLRSDTGHAKPGNAIVALIDNSVKGMIFTFPVKRYDYSSHDLSQLWLDAYSSFFNPVFGEDGMHIIHSFAVYPEFHGKGIGKTLLTLTIEKARKEGSTGIVLGTSESNPASHAAYESCGFRVAGSECMTGMDIMEYWF